MPRPLTSQCTETLHTVCIVARLQGGRLKNHGSILGRARDFFFWFLMALVTGREVHEVYHSSLYQTEVKNAWEYTSPHTPSWLGSNLKHSDTFTITGPNHWLLISGITALIIR
jgi:hypothetical protein